MGILFFSLELIHVVPIVQSVKEFEDLYQKCAKKCDIVISYHTSLGTKGELKQPM